MDLSWKMLGLTVSIVVVTLLAIAVAQLFIDSDLVVAGLGVAIALMSALLQFTAAKDRETDARLFAEKRDVYVSLMNTIMGLFHDKGTKQSDAQQAKLVRTLQEIRTQLIIWGSYDTVAAIDKMSSMSGSNSPEQTVVAGTKWIAELVRSIRADLGHKDPGKAELEMALGMLNEPDRSNIRELIRKSGQRQKS